MAKELWKGNEAVAEAAIRVVIAKAFYPVFGVESLFFIEPFAWVMAWLFVLVPYYFYQKKLLSDKIPAAAD